MAGGWVSTLKSWFALQPPALTGIPTTFDCLQPHVISNAECLSAYIKEVSETLATSHWGSFLPVGQLMSEFGSSDACRWLASLPVGAALPGSAMTALYPLLMPQEACRFQLWEERSCHCWVCHLSLGTGLWLLATTAAQYFLTMVTMVVWPLCPSWICQNRTSMLHVQNRLLPKYWHKGPRPRTATQSWRYCIRTASLKCLFMRWTRNIVTNFSLLASMELWQFGISRPWSLPSRASR